MKMKLGNKIIQLNKVRKVNRIGDQTAKIHFVNGDSIQIACGVQHSNNGLSFYPGTVEELKAFIQRNKGWR